MNSKVVIVSSAETVKSLSPCDFLRQQAGMSDTADGDEGVAMSRKRRRQPRIAPTKLRPRPDDLHSGAIATLRDALPALVRFFDTHADEFSDDPEFVGLSRLTRNWLTAVESPDWERLSQDEQVLLLAVAGRVDENQVWEASEEEVQQEVSRVTATLAQLGFSLS